MKSALVLGATGFVGGYLVNELLVSKKYDRITTLIRTASLEPHPVLEQTVFDFQDYSCLDDLLPVRDIFCCLGTTIQTAGSKKAFRFVDFELPLRFAQWAEKTGAESYSIVTAMGANPSSRIFYNQVKGNIEEEVKKLNIPTVQIFRPSLILGPRKEFRIGEVIGKGFMRIMKPFMIGSLKKYRGIHARTLAKGMVYHLENSKTGVHIIESNRIAELV